MDHATNWRTSSFSGGENNDCVEVANTLEALRDSKNPNGGTLSVDLRPMMTAVLDGSLTR
jgi:hypothetical protein